ncbi:MAG: sugar phosphate nucleotidyltransferase [Candidatus Omnitrophica bacterium]|nr:sugar phosphate nucleotidyltransferase [Candidatus Omnitrophota bacterium]
MNHVIVLSGGSGTRFWPLSRKSQPKQFLNLCSDQPMIEQTIQRVRKLTEIKNIYIAANKVHEKNIRSCMARLKIPQKNIFFEPQAKNTFAPIAVLSKLIYEADPQAVIAVFPSDHYIKEENKFLKVLKQAFTAAKTGYIVTIGITPYQPETGYGYIKITGQAKRQGVYKVKKFFEKPEVKLAKKFIQDKGYYWNAGMFIFKAESLLEEIKKFHPLDYRLLKKIDSQEKAKKLWSKFISTSIDYAIMEKTKRSALIPADFQWSDLGSWLALKDLLPKDKQGNCIRGDVVDIGSTNLLALPGSRFLATIGLKDLVIVGTKDALLVCAKDKTQDVKKLVETLKNKKLFKLL